MTVLPDRYEIAQTWTLRHGSHDANDDGQACLLEAVSWVAGEKWTARPQCVDPVLAAFGRSWNDGLPDDSTRTALLAPFIPRLIGTRSTPDVQDRRAFMAADWAVRTFTPAWLRLAGLDDCGDELAGLEELASVGLCEQAMPAIGRARERAAAAGDAAWAAAGDAAWAAAGDAAWDAAWDAARDAAGDAAWAAAWAAAGDAAWADAWADARADAWDAAWAAAWDAAWAAAGDAAWDAARDALAPTVVQLRQSAADLFDRMIRLTEDAS